MTDDKELISALRMNALWVTTHDAADRIEELEDALTKTEMIVRIIASSDGYSRFGEAVDLSCEYLAELTGGKDE